MPKHSRKLPSDPIQAAHSILVQLTGEEPRIIPDREAPAPVALGRKSALKGAKALTSQQQRLSALKAAHVRWSKKITTS
jgi:hypothetical protein